MASAWPDMAEKFDYRENQPDADELMRMLNIQPERFARFEGSILAACNQCGQAAVGGMPMLRDPNGRATWAMLRYVGSHWLWPDEGQFTTLRPGPAVAADKNADSPAVCQIGIAC